MMDWLLPVAAGLAVFAARDVALLAAAPAQRRTAYGLAWAAIQVILFTGLGWAAESVSRDRAHALLREPAWWMPAVAIHAALWAAMTWIQRRGAAEKAAAWVTLFPAPMFLFAAGALVWAALTRTGRLEGWTAGLAVGGLWVAAVSAIAAWRRSRGGAEARSALEFAATANLSAILLLPIQQSADAPSGIAEHPIDWVATAVPLGLTASLVLLSFLFHRFRSARRAA